MGSRSVAVELQKNQVFTPDGHLSLIASHLRFDIFLPSILYAFRSYKMLKDLDYLIYTTLSS